MRHIGTTIALACFGACLAAQAAEVEVNGTAEAKVASAYIWRGQVLNEEAVIQPSLAVDLGPYFTALVWGTWDLTDQPGTWSRNRVDTTVMCTGGGGKNIFKSGVVAYIYHDSSFSHNDDTYEVFLGYTRDIVSLPSIRFYYDLGDVQGVFGTLSFAHSFDLASDRAALDFRVGVNWADEKYTRAFFSMPAVVDANGTTNANEFIPAGSKVLDITATMELPVFFGEERHGVFTPGVSHMIVADGDLKDALEAARKQADETVLSVSLGYTF